MSKFRRETIRGEPIRVGDHAIVPEARVWSWQTKEAVIHDAGHVSGRGIMIVRAQPTALIDHTADTTRRIRVVDANRQLELILLIAAVLLPIVLNAAVILLRQARPNPNQKGTVNDV
jgi:hypothetical protein